MTKGETMWAKLSDGFHDDPRILAVGLEGAGMFASALSYSARHLTDGVVPHEWVATRATPGLLERLEAQALLIRRDDGSYEVSGYLNYNPSRQTATARREKDRTRKSALGQKGNEARHGTPDSNDDLRF